MRRRRRGRGNDYGRRNKLNWNWILKPYFPPPNAAPVCLYDGPAVVMFGVGLTWQVRLQNSLDLARAGHLFTKEATPKIYYRPYLLLPEQKTLIEQQIAQAQAQIEEKEQGTAIQHRDSVEEDDSGDRR